MSWSIATRNLWRSKRRTAVTGMAVMLGVAGLSLAAGYVYRVKNYMTVWSVYHNQTGHVSVYRAGGLEGSLVRPRDFTLTPDELAFLSREAPLVSAQLHKSGAVEKVVPFLHGTGLAGNGCKTIPFSARGVPVEYERWMRAHPAVLKWTPELAPVKAGRDLGAANLPDGVVAGQGLLALLSKDETIFTGKTVESFVPDCQSPGDVERLRFDANLQLAANDFKGDFNVVDTTIVGSFSSGYTDVDASVLSVPLPLLQSLYSTENATYAAVFLTRPEDAARVASALVERAKAAGYAWDAYEFSDKTVGPVLVGTLTFLYTLGGAIAVVLCGLASLTILNTMTIAVSERTREMGMLRSLGFRKKDLTALFVKEAVVVIAASAGLGIVVSYVAAALINSMNFRFKPPGVADTMQFVIVLAPWFLGAIALVLGLLGTLATRVACRAKVNESVAKLLSSSGA
jgi:putative ABC transport system permease protein